MKKSFALLGLSAACGLLGIAGCAKLRAFFSFAPHQPPDSVVKQFVELSANAKVDSDKNKLMELCSGEMRRAFERMTGDAFHISYLNSNVKVKSFKVLSTETSTDRAHVAYQVTIENKQGTDSTLETNEREVELVQNSGAWQIDAIRMRGSDKIAFVRGMIF